MSVRSIKTSWEKRLFLLAYDPSCEPAVDLSDHQGLHGLQAFKDAISECEIITAEHSRSFYLASGLLPREKCRAMRVLYSFCRTADNLADNDVEHPTFHLQELREAITGRGGSSGTPMVTAWLAIFNQYEIPICYAEQLVDGVVSDLNHQPYQTFEDLSVYCYGVASTVGLMSMHITGFSDQRAVPYAIKLGVALQLTNILRDVAEDWASGRLYLPVDELADFDLSEKDIDMGCVDERWRRFMRFQIARVRQLYVEALPGIALLHRDGRLAVAAAAFLYRGILDDIEEHDFDVFSRRAHVSSPRKFALLVRALVFARRVTFRSSDSRRSLDSFLDGVED